MHWFEQHASAIQAIASIVGVFVTGVLAYITYRYVQVTREIARSSSEQVKQIRETVRAGQEQYARSLFYLARRLRNSLSQITEPSDTKLRTYSQLTEGDIVDLEVLAKGVGGTGILSCANEAVVSLRNVLATIQKVKGIREGIGWAPPPQELEHWRKSIEGSHRSLQEIETACQQIAPSGP